MGSRAQKKVLLVSMAAGVMLFGGELLFAKKHSGVHAPVTAGDDHEITAILPAPKNEVMKQIKTVAKADAALSNAEGALVAGRKIIQGSNANGRSRDDCSVSSSVDSEVPWQFTKESDKSQPSIPLSESVKAFSVVKLDHRPANFPSQGDQMTLPMFDGRAITANVENVKTMGNGDRIWTGHLDGFGDDYSVVMTYGDTLTFATINTPDGNYSLEAKDGLGWLYKNPSIIDLVGPDSTDFMIRDVN